MEFLKKAMRLLPVIALCLSVAACGDDNGGDGPDDVDKPKIIKSVEVAYRFEVTKDLFRVADIEASWTKADGTMAYATMTQPQSKATVAYSSFPAQATLSMKFTQKSELPDEEYFNCDSNIDWLEYLVTYEDGTKALVTRNYYVTGEILIPADKIPAYLDHLNERPESVAYTIDLVNNRTEVEIKRISATEPNN